MSMLRNRDIRGFFTKAAVPGPGRASQSQSAASPQRERAPPSSPATRPEPTPKPVLRTEEVRCSDDEDGDSDDSLESITAFIERKRGPLAPVSAAKRIASTSTPVKSPLAVQPKHKYDLKYLVNHTRQSDRADESARRADELINQIDDEDGNIDDGAPHLTDVQKNPALLHKTAKALLHGDEEEAKGDKLLRAMNRTRADGVRRAHYFFNVEKPLFKPPRKVFPEWEAGGCWRFLADPRTRNQAIILGLPHAMLVKGRTLPDELFLWVLDEVCVERNAQLRTQYCNIVALCSGSVARLVDDARLYTMLAQIGGPKHAFLEEGDGDTKLQSLPRTEDPYPGRDWAGLAAFLGLVERIAPNLSAPNAIGAVQLLLRMGLDPVISTMVRAEHAAAIEALVGALPKSGTRQWNDSCGTLASYLLSIVDSPEHRILPISRIPATTSKLQDLRRRLAAAVLFPSLVLIPASGTSSITTRPVDDALAPADILHRLEQPDFRVGPDADYDQLRALFALVDTAVGGGGFLRPSPSASPLSSITTTTASSPAGPGEKPTSANGPRSAAGGGGGGDAADAAVDALAARLKAAHDRIHDSALLERKVAKASIDVVAKRLAYAVRSRPPPKTSIFDHDGEREREREARQAADLPRQRAFMKSWAAGRREREKERESGSGSGSGSASTSTSGSGSGSRREGLRGGGAGRGRRGWLR
ncbi:hypothetical protein GGS23DRAFT_612707 [Durotheca rogersii]|uniref:uncharacterized protein n=1 Tax=Durotheca rogersii TaxID=419775 RepID=UPI00221FD47C|nr:uncharacterized protein GGS23DRAFT_612707 [Durotheca rogersii]KAI5867565.1 hypothetical protein GGS23DRAFT_612707 [Durotheca rogersii]